MQEKIDLRGKSIVVMGVSGCGKTCVGKWMQETFDLNFIDADDYHSAESIQKMSRGEPLSDTDRSPWLERLGEALRLQPEGGVVLACSALKKQYRDQLRGAMQQNTQTHRLLFIYLKGTKEVIQPWIEERKNHFMAASLLESQFQTLEEPSAAETNFLQGGDTIIIELTEDFSNVYKEIRERFAAN
eukprot:Gregarina_sp_Pseudo_9__199@NODE_112_length_4197_cov_53_172439_g104_i0_p3_GENE_NODE_112_length_4197_cov_53_172439_g104_i0NODE_112_length_4197_cov_53_172439_g104_i0_p3_ORF_typecomplete_len186_score21_81SKI/PF01202_22/8_6e27AAA_33/PF13671_6/1_2e11AAA_33/PF13671_6/5e02APS_kinase/PF01583_20/2_2e08AAA_18/PF13238_6/4_6e05tRNA_lig_kinase/PF08303_11/0_00053tRNA_lig_kinase/PF08303_11/1e03dNK/PF01712_19/0_096CPT/PF07931_12/0_0034CoaE/PF01121_20/0_012CoaE/PF01121_20/8e02NUFIP1/PF10453_9/0_011Zeta_toxin/PF06